MILSSLEASLVRKFIKKSSDQFKLFQKPINITKKFNICVSIMPSNVCFTANDAAVCHKVSCFIAIDTPLLFFFDIPII